jgi:hypothetical protein
MAHVLVRARGWSREADTCLVRRRFLVRGGDFSCEAETCRGDPSCRELVRDAANWPKTGRLASVDLYQGPKSSLS